MRRESKKTNKQQRNPNVFSYLKLTVFEAIFSYFVLINTENEISNLFIIDSAIRAKKNLNKVETYPQIVPQCLKS